MLTLASPATQAAGAQTILWDTVVGDGDFTYPGAVAGGWYCDVAGLYHIDLAIARDAVGTTSPASGRLLHEGSTVVGAMHPTSTAALDLSMSTLLMLAVGERLTAQATLHNTATAGFAEARTSLRIARVGPVRWTG